MHLVDDWRRVLKRAWSVRLLVLVLILDAAETVIPYIDLPAWVSPAVTVAALVARFTAQPRMRGEDEKQAR